MNLRSWADLWRLKTALGEGMFLFSDLNGTAMMWELTPVACDTQGPDFLHTLQQKLRQLLLSVPEDDPPWVLQWFLSDEPADSPTGEQLCPGDEPLQQQWRALLDGHMQRCRRGVFRPLAASEVWRAKQRRVRLLLYPSAASDTEMLDAARRLEETALLAGIHMQPLCGDDCLQWLGRWLTGLHPTAPPGPVQQKDDEQLAIIDSLFAGSHHTDLPVRALCGQDCRYDTRLQVWRIGDRLHRFIPIGNLLQTPSAGALCAEIGADRGGIWDRMPPDTVLCLCSVHLPAEKSKRRIAKVLERARGNTADAVSRRTVSADALQALAQGESLCRVSGGVYVVADSEEQLEERTRRVLALAPSAGLSPVPPRQDHFQMDAWCQHLPGNFDYAADKLWFRRRSRLWHVGHLAAMLPLYGRSRGTGTPGVLLFNRGGEPLLCDPLSRTDRMRNAHSLIIGPTGSGKTALLIYLLLSMAARYKPRLFLVTTLPTFGLLGQWLERFGWSVHRVELTANGEHPIPPFAGAADALAASAEGKSGGDRDTLGELELIASIMVSDQGGKLQYWQSDVLRTAVLDAVRDGQDPMISQVVDQLRTEAEKPVHPERHRQIILEMAGAMNRYTQGVAGTIFNRPGPLWPEADCTILNLGIAGRRGYEHLRTVAYTTFIQRINNLVEANGGDRRQTLVVTDEAHVILGEPQLSLYLSAITAQWRTWGAWKWIITQSLRQIPEDARSVLNLMEWWWCLGLDNDETDSVSAFKGLSAQQKAMLQSTVKEPGKYVEGVVLSDRLSTCFRAVLPALALALAQTDKEERAERVQLMQQMQIGELDAALEIAARMEASSADL